MTDVCSMKYVQKKEAEVDRELRHLVGLTNASARAAKLPGV